MDGCTSKATLGHIMSNCQTMLHQGRYTHRHDSCLNYIYKTLKENKPNHLEIFADLEDCKINGGTVPPDVTLTGSRPDLVLVDRQSKKVSLIELTITWDTTANTDSARDRKQARYAYLKEDIEERGFHCFNNPLEIGTRGYISQRNKSTISYLAEICKVRKPKLFVKTIGKIALLGSYQIYLARNSQDWSSGGLLIP